MGSPSPTALWRKDIAPDMKTHEISVCYYLLLFEVSVYCGLVTSIVARHKLPYTAEKAAEEPYKIQRTVFIESNLDSLSVDEFSWVP